MRQSGSDAIDKSLQSNIICSICSGYLVDAVTLTECLHFFCRACLLRHLKTIGHRCPKCYQEFDKDLKSAFCSDKLLQSLVYKLVPNFFWHQLRKRYRALKKGRRGKWEHKKNSTQQIATFSTQLCCPEEKISLMLEYVPMSRILCENRELDNRLETGEQHRTSFKRYFRCPAKTRLEHLKKLLEAKLAMNDNYVVYFTDSSLKTLLPEDYCLQDLVYIHSYDRQQPLPLLFTLARMSSDEDKPPVLDIQCMPQLLPETPTLQKHSPNIITSPEDQPQIPKMSVCLSSSAFENGSVHPPIITTCSTPFQTSNQSARKKRKNNVPLKKPPESGSPPSTGTEKKLEISKTSPPSTSTQPTLPSAAKITSADPSKQPSKSFPAFSNFPGPQLPPYMSAALLANSPFGVNFSAGLMNGNFLWPNTSFPQQQVNGNSSIKKSPMKKQRSSTEIKDSLNQMPSKEFNLLLQQQKQLQQMFGQSGAAIASGQMQLPNNSAAFFPENGLQKSAAVTSPVNQLKLPTISSGVVGSAASRASTSVNGFGFKDARIAAGPANCTKQTLATT